MNDFDYVEDPQAETNDGNVTQVDVAKLLNAKEAMEKAIDDTNDAAAQVGYQIGVAAEKSRVLEIISFFKSQEFVNDNGKALLDALLVTIDREEEEVEEESEVTTDASGDV